MNKKKVYCRDCKHYRLPYYYTSTYPHIFTQDGNDNNDCKNYKKKKWLIWK